MPPPVKTYYNTSPTTYGIVRPKISPISQLREMGKTPVIDLGTVAAIKTGKITIQKDIQSFTPGGVIFVDGSSVDYDMVLLCTGYKAQLAQFIPSIEAFLDVQGNLVNCIGSGDWVGMYFMGFNVFKTGGILSMIREESEQVLEDLKK